MNRLPKAKRVAGGSSEKFLRKKRSRHGNQHLHVIATRERQNATRTLTKVRVAVGDARREASVEKCYWIEVGREWKRCILSRQQGDPLRGVEVERMVGAWVEFS